MKSFEDAANGKLEIEVEFRHHVKDLQSTFSNVSQEQLRRRSCWSLRILDWVKEWMRSAPITL